MRYKASQTHKNLEDPGRFWYVVDQTNTRIGYGFMDCESQIMAEQIANEMNTAFLQGVSHARQDMRRSIGL